MPGVPALSTLIRAIHEQPVVIEASTAPTTQAHFERCTTIDRSLTALVDDHSRHNA